METCMMRSFCFAPALLVLAAPGGVRAQSPAGLAASALADSSFTWIQRAVPGFRDYFMADSYPAQHQDSLLARLPPAARHAETLLGLAPLAELIDLFFVESREQMRQLVGAGVTGFAQPSARSVFLVTNSTWRAFERHEVMHVVAGQAWGRWGPNADWLLEGLAQAADGRCGQYSNAGVLLSLTARDGWIPLVDVLSNFRAQPDLRAYLQAAVFVDYLLGRFGPAAVRELWNGGVTPATAVGGGSLEALEQEWRAALRESVQPTADELDVIETKGCG
jgi:hypothetical protein